MRFVSEGQHVYRWLKTRLHPKQGKPISCIVICAAGNDARVRDDGTEVENWIDVDHLTDPETTLKIIEARILQADFNFNFPEYARTARNVGSTTGRFTSLLAPNVQNLPKFKP